MDTDEEKLGLRIRYSSMFSLDIVFRSAEQVERVSYTNWSFAVFCMIRHPGGKFTYDIDDLLSFEVRTFERFDEQLDAIRDGRGELAELVDVGEMFLFRLRLDGRQLKTSIQIREFQAGGDLTILNAGFRVDYDLFVNKLSRGLKDFIKDLHAVQPEIV